MSMNAKQLLTEMIRSRDSVQHEASVMSFVQRLESLMPDEVLPVHEMLGPLAALIALGHGLTVKNLSSSSRSVHVDELGNKQYTVDIAEHLPVIERAG